MPIQKVFDSTQLYGLDGIPGSVLKKRHAIKSGATQTQLLTGRSEVTRSHLNQLVLIMANRGPSYGLSAECQLKAEAKFSLEGASMCLSWLEQVLGRSIGVPRGWGISQMSGEAQFWGRLMLMSSFV